MFKTYCKINYSTKRWDRSFGVERPNRFDLSVGIFVLYCVVAYFVNRAAVRNGNGVVIVTNVHGNRMLSRLCFFRFDCTEPIFRRFLLQAPDIFQEIVRKIGMQYVVMWFIDCVYVISMLFFKKSFTSVKFFLWVDMKNFTEFNNAFLGNISDAPLRTPFSIQTVLFCFSYSSRSF